jgi:hypothetical protein
MLTLGAKWILRLALNRFRRGSWESAEYRDTPLLTEVRPFLGSVNSPPVLMLGLPQATPIEGSALIESLWRNIVMCDC